MKKNIICLPLVILTIACTNYPSAADYSLPPGTALPVCNLLLTDSTTYLNTAQIPEGKPFVLFLFGPQCPYSKAQIKDFTANITELGEVPIYVVTPYSFQAMKQFYQSYHLDRYPNITTATDYKNTLAAAFHIKAVPYIAVFDDQKKLKTAFTGKTAVRLVIKAVEQQ